MEAILDPIIEKLFDYVQEEVAMFLGVKEELRKLLERMKSIQSLLQDAEKRRFDEISTELWLYQLKDAMYEADDILDLCGIEGAKLLADQNPKSENSPECCTTFYCCFPSISIPLRHKIGSRIKKLNDSLDLIYENRKKYRLERLPTPEPPRITLVDTRQTDSEVDDLVVGTEVEDAADKLIHRLVFEKVEVKCLLFAIVGMGGVGKTTLAQKIFNHEDIKNNFKMIWVCISQTYSIPELLQQIIKKVGGSYGDAKTKAELLPLLSDSIASVHSLFLVLDDVWRADVWVDLLRVRLCKSNTIVRVLITTRDANLANDIDFAYIHRVEPLSPDSSWDMLRKLTFFNGEEERENELKQLGFEIVKKCGHLPLAIKTIAGVLRKDRTWKAWDNILSNKGWSISKLPEGLRGALYLSFEDLPSHIKQCFLYLSLYPEDWILTRSQLARLWVAEGFIKEQEENSLLEEVAEKYFDELLERNLLLPSDGAKMHDVIRSLAIFLSAEESSYGNEYVRKNPTTPTKLRRISVINNRDSAAQILDSVADLGSLRTLLSRFSNLSLDDERLRRLSHLRVLDISSGWIEILPDSIGSLVHLRYLDLSGTEIKAIPESIQHLAYLQFFSIQNCRYLTQLPCEIIRLDKLRYLNLFGTPLRFIPKGIGKLRQLNELRGFVVINNDSSSQLEELKSLKQIRKLEIEHLRAAESGTNIFTELSNLSELALKFTEWSSSYPENTEEQQKVEKLFDELMPPTKLEKLSIVRFFGRRFPTWMASTLERCVRHLTKLSLVEISSCNQLPSLGQLPELKMLFIKTVSELKKIGPEFISGGVNSAINSSTRIAFPKLEELYIGDMPKLKEWSFGAPVDENVSPKLKLLPSLQKLKIYDCPLLKQLPKGLKHSAMKSLDLVEAKGLKSLDDLPPETKNLEISFCENLEKICCLPGLKCLRIKYCESLSCVEKLDSLESLVFHDINSDSFPEWLLKLLQQQVLQNDSNKNFQFELTCSNKVLQECVQGGSYWDLIQHISRVHAKTGSRQSLYYLHYRKQPNLYDTNL